MPLFLIYDHYVIHCLSVMIVQTEIVSPAEDATKDSQYVISQFEHPFVYMYQGKAFGNEMYCSDMENILVKFIVGMQSLLCEESTILCTCFVKLQQEHIRPIQIAVQIYDRTKISRSDHFLSHLTRQHGGQMLRTTFCLRGANRPIHMNDMNEK